MTLKQAKKLKKGQLLKVVSAYRTRYLQILRFSKITRDPILPINCMSRNEEILDLGANYSPRELELVEGKRNKKKLKPRKKKNKKSNHGRVRS